MQKAETQHNQMQNRPAQRQGGVAALESPQGERIAQLEAMAEHSPQVGKQAQLAAMANGNSRMSVQRKAISAMHNSPSLTAQRQKLDSLTGEAAQSAEAPAQPSAPVQLSGREGDEWDPGPGQGESAPPTPRPVQGGQERPPLPETESLIQDGYSPRAGEVRDETAQLVAAGESSQLRVTQCAGDSVKPNNTGLPDNLKSGIESLSGMSMDSVKVHYNSSQPAQLNALAYAQGTDIHVAPGQEQHLPHEAWHVVQQAQGRVKPTMQMKGGVPVNDDAGLEHEADVMGGRALAADVPQLMQDENKLIKSAPIYSSANVSYRLVNGYGMSTVQRFDPEKEREHLQDDAGKWRLAMLWHSDNKKRRDQVLKGILKEASLLLNSKDVTLVSLDQGGSGMTPTGGKVEDRTYKIKINPEKPWGDGNEEYSVTENRLRSVILHELIHVAADQTYQFNENESSDSLDRAYNIDSDEERLSKDEDDRIYNEIVRIQNLVSNDLNFSIDEKNYVKFRLNRAQSWQQELDTVMSELVYYFDMQGVSANSPTSVAVTDLAKVRFERRSQREGPVACRERLLTEKIKKEIMKTTLLSIGNSEALALYELLD
ncbi:MAG: DUF4157 domain-containing protein [Gallionella sp.]